jgi:hypothetical protein
MEEMKTFSTHIKENAIEKNPSNLLWLQYLIELRRNPELNPKIDVLSVLSRWKDNEDIYISFVEDVVQSKESHKSKWIAQWAQGDNEWSKIKVGMTYLGNRASGFKIGINPHSQYNTPTGIYTYPLAEAWRKYADFSKKVFDVPFAGHQPMIYVLESKGKLLELFNYNSANYDKDIVNLRNIMIKWEMANNNVSEAYAWEIFKGIERMGLGGARVDTIGGKFWNVTRMVFGRMMGSVENKIIKSKHQDVVMPMFKDEQMKADFNDESIRIEMKVSKKELDNKGTIKWNKLFRDLGYDGVTDKGSQGIIHPAEPMQAVFFSVKGFKVLDMVMNKAYIEMKPSAEYLKFKNQKKGTLSDTQLTHIKNVLNLKKGEWGA